MPEGHTLRRLATDLDTAFAGRRVRVGSPQGRFAADAAVVDGSVLVGADSAGKHLFVELEHDHLVHVHLGLIGTFDVHAGVDEVPPPVGQVRLRIVAPGDGVPGSGTAAYADLRGATQCELVGPARRDEILARLGPDPLRVDADPQRAWRRIKASQRPIGDLLMDQAVLAGVGNVYRAEVLFRHGLHPLRPGATLRVGQWRAIWDDLVVLMGEGVVANRIDTVRPEHTPEAMGREPRVDDHGGEVYVYRRTSQPCLVCGSTVRTEVLAGRNVFWCARCQPRFRSRAVQSSSPPARGPST
ncbi:Fpg/Nei family DNA glycosylase [Nocardioides terrigena]|uniref:Fpg/Nei family DNA glycosylase n=1 Tax=Nocardioides terrigena TaxID=424797 RepID=UPI000D31AD4B|nr:DNA-formamidopyrimidine glycosylase family protein [Nocardioides terrigena]